MEIAEPVLVRNISVLTDVKRISAGPLMSLEGAPSPRGDRTYVGRHQLVTVTIDAQDTPTAVAVSLDRVPTRAQYASAIRVTASNQPQSVLASINEYHGAAGSEYEWTPTRIWFIGSCAGTEQQFLVI